MVFADVLFQKSTEGSAGEFEWAAPMKSTREKVFASWLKSERMISSLGVTAMSSKFPFVFKVRIPPWNQL